MRTLLPGAAEKAADATNGFGGTRCVIALTVATSTRGRSAAPRVKASRASAVEPEFFPRLGADCDEALTTARVRKAHDL